MNTVCPQCKSDKVVTGDYTYNLPYVSAWAARLMFRPRGLRLLARVLGSLPFVKDPILACLDCGLVWSHVEPRELRQLVITWKKAKLQEQTGS